MFDDIPDPVRYFVAAAGGYKSGYWPFPEPSREFPRTEAGDVKLWGPLETEDVLDLLWRDSSVPHWIDICLPTIEKQSTCLVLLASVSWTSTYDDLYYRPGGQLPSQSPDLDCPPFQVTRMEFSFQRGLIMGGTDAAAKDGNMTGSQKVEVEMEFWHAIKDRNDPDDFDLYIQQFPTGIFIELAKRRLANLRGVAPADCPR